MRAPVLIVLFALPLLELAVLIKLGSVIGFWPTVAIIAVTALAGILALRSQGLASLRQANAAMRADRPPVEPVLDGALRLLGGILLITPGVLMDVAGALLLVPALRRLVTRRMISRGETVSSVRFKVFRSGAGGGPARPQAEPRPKRTPPRGDGPVIEGEFERIDEPKGEARRPPRADRKT